MAFDIGRSWSPKSESGVITQTVPLRFLSRKCKETIDTPEVTTIQHTATANYLLPVFIVTGSIIWIIILWSISSQFRVKITGCKLVKNIFIIIHHHYPIGITRQGIGPLVGFDLCGFKFPYVGIFPVISSVRGISTLIKTFFYLSIYQIGRYSIICKFSLLLHELPWKKCFWGNFF